MTHTQPNIIMLVLDTHRADRMSIYGYGKDTTPVLGDLSRGGTLFDWAVAPGQWTIPSHASMFTGLYPTAHQTIQSYNTLPETIPTVAEILRDHGYETVGFCNNPLVGVLDNGLKRGFNQFYNYGATFPDVPKIGDDRPLRRLQRTLTDLIKHNFSTPIERQFGRSPLLLRLATMPIFVPVWSRLFNFKGNTVQSLKDAGDYLRYHHSVHRDRPLFMFINMMETHFPYYPPRRWMDRWVPYLKRDREAREFIQNLNTQSYRWMAPILHPLKPIEEAVLRDVYDAEVAFQDRQLRRVFRYLKRSGQLDNTMVIVVSDHGESHGEHSFMGHAFAIYNELVRVPLLIHYPELFPPGKRIGHIVSTRRLFHTIMEAAGIEPGAIHGSTRNLSLTRSIGGLETEPAGEKIVTEAYPPMNFLNVMEVNHPEVVERFRVRETRRAIYDRRGKLITIGDKPDEFFDVLNDPLEATNLLERPYGHENDLIGLERDLEDFVATQEAVRDGTAAPGRIDYSDNPELLERLRGLGYIE
jgi:uncharacterized sulfatase